MKLFAKIINGLPTTTCAAEEDTDLIAQILADGFKPYDDSAPKPSGEELQADVLLDPEKVTDLRSAVTKSDAGGLLTAVPVESAASGSKLDSEAKLAAVSLSEPVPTYRDDGERIVLEWQILENSPVMITAEIDRLKAELAATDYQVIKCSEYSLTKRKPPYDVSALHSSRQALRDRIGELEELGQIAANRQ